MSRLPPPSATDAAPSPRGHIGVQNTNIYYHTKGPYKANGHGERVALSGSSYTTEFPITYELKAGTRTR